MPDRLIRDELLDSDRWLELSRNTHRLAFVCLLFKVDSFGNMEAGDGTLWRIWRDPLGLVDRHAILDILTALLDADLSRPYMHDGKRYLHVPRTRFRMRYMTRICPLSPWTTDQQIQILEKNSPGASQVPTVYSQQGVGVGVGVGVGEKLEPSALVGQKPDAKKAKDEAEKRAQQAAEAKAKAEADAEKRAQKAAEKRQRIADAVELLNFLNLKTGRKYQPVDANLNFIIARLNEGATKVQIRQVIANRCAAWLPDPEMSEYLRPATLFNAEKFNQYLGLIGATEPPEVTT